MNIRKPTVRAVGLFQIVPPTFAKQGPFLGGVQLVYDGWTEDAVDWWLTKDGQVEAFLYFNDDCQRWVVEIVGENEWIEIDTLSWIHVEDAKRDIQEAYN